MCLVYRRADRTHHGAWQRLLLTRIRVSDYGQKLLLIGS